MSTDHSDDSSTEKPAGDIESAGPTPPPQAQFDGAALDHLHAIVDLTIPREIGRYHVIEKIGSGGMGVVLKAEQRTPVRRIVAIKVIKLGLDSKSVMARFEAEQQALAMMDHPNIAKVLDAGAIDENRPYFVMEYVPGEPITDYCDRQKLSLPDRLKLFRDMCSAVQHAHTKGIIHRDLKPSNVLICMKEGQPTVKIIDFGLAKALQGRLATQTYFTEFGQLIGTPEYMSPEQAEMNHLDIDTRTDIYGLGVMLYELLTGCLPFDPHRLREAAYAEIQRIIREDAPPRPSSRLSSLGAAATIVAEKRRMELNQLTSQLHRELEWIPLKAMRKDRTERYQTAAAMEQDISNYLQGWPLMAGPESTLYRAKKLYLRNKGRFAAALLFVVLVAAGLLPIRLIVARQQKETHAAELVKRLTYADTAGVPAIVAELADYRQWADPLLRQENTNAAAESRQKLHTSLALLPVDPGQVDFLYGRLLTATPDDVPVIRDALLPHKDALHERLWSVVKTPDKGKAATRLRAAAALATYDPQNRKWTECSPGVANDLVRENPYFLRQWTEAFRPVKNRLLLALAGAFRDPRPEHAAERTLATSLLSDYAADQPQVLAELLIDADEKQFADLFPRFKEHGERGLPVLIGTVDQKLPPDANDEDKEKLAKQQANAAVALLKMNRSAKVWPVLKHGPDPRVRSYLIHRLSPLGADPQNLIHRLEEEPDLSIRRALVLSLGEFDEQALPERKMLIGRLRETYRTDPDPGLHAAAEWVLRSWKEDEWLQAINAQWADDENQRAHKLETAAQPPPDQESNPSSQWYVNGQGQTMVVIPGPVEFIMGSPPTEANREKDEQQHKMRIGRTFALAAKPVTVEEFTRSLKDRHFVKDYPSSDEHSQLPAAEIIWNEAAAYCNWLSKKEGIAPDQWCYETDNDFGHVLRIRQDYLKLIGYRLPTEAELEYSTRAGAITSRYYGETDELLPNYAWYADNSHRHAWPVGTRKPNDLGFFDLQGNVYCWSQEQVRNAGDFPAEDVEDDLDMNFYRAPRGGSFEVPASKVRSACRLTGLPNFRSPNVGFRPARTLRTITPTR